MNLHDFEIIKKLKERNKPVLIFGNMHYATAVLRFLKLNEVFVEAFVVDGATPKTKMLEGLLVKSIDEYMDYIDEYSLVIGFCNIECTRSLMRYAKLLKCSIFNLWDPDMLFEWDDQFWEEHSADFDRIEALLFDDFSKKTLKALIEARREGNLEDIFKLSVPNQYFNTITFQNNTDEEIFVDCGAFNGDTALEYMDFVSNRYKRIYAFEPNANNMSELKANTHNDKRIQYISKGTWSEETTLRFVEDSSASQVDEKGEIEVEVTSIDSIVGADRVTFIKMDVEGAEFNSLLGAEKTIIRDMPKLAICVYHKRDDIIKFIDYLKQFGDEKRKYRFYLRHHSCTSYETVLYAIPEG